MRSLKPERCGVLELADLGRWSGEVLSRRSSAAATLELRVGKVVTEKD